MKNISVTLYSTNYSFFFFFCGLQLTQLVTMYFNRLVSSNVLYNSLCVYEYIFFDEFGFDIFIVFFFFLDRLTYV